MPKIGFNVFSPLSNGHSKIFQTFLGEKNRSLYRTWVSEVMLQQTTVATVSGRFKAFLQQFPDIKSLAAADEKNRTLGLERIGVLP